MYADIVEKIIHGEFPPGRQLGEEELARTYNVSRTPVREILIKLERDGLVERSRSQTARVVSFTADDVEQIYEIRKALECLSIRGAARNLKLADLLAFERRFEGLSERQGEEWVQQHVAVDQEFHWLIVSHSGNRRLIAYLENVSLLLNSLRAIVQPHGQGAKDRSKEHLAIIRALLRRDADEAERLLAAHIDIAKRYALDALFARNGKIRMSGPV
jgi:DNA-binding GntR family transcriptional regulator